MQQLDIAPHIDELTRALGDKIGNTLSKEDLEAEFQKYLDYGVPVEQAKKTILRHYGATAPAAAAPTTADVVPIADIQGDLPFVRLKARLVTLNPKEVNVRGEAKTIYWGLLGDPTGTVSYTSWRPLEGLEKGDALAIDGAYTKTWNGEVQVNFGDRCRIEKIDASEVPEAPLEFKDTPIEDLRTGLRGIRITGRVLGVDEREVTVKGEPKMLYSGHIADATGKVEFTDWHGHGLKADQVVTIEGGYVRAFRGMPQLNIDTDAVIKPAEEDLPPAEELDVTPILELGEIVARGGGEGRFRGTLVEVRPGSGLVWRCGEEECNRVLGHDKSCRLHGPQEGTPDLRIKGVLDDGTGAVSFVAGRAITEALLGRDVDSCLEEAREAMRPEVIMDQLADTITGYQYTIDGFARSDEYGLMLISRTMSRHEAVDEDAAKAALAELEALQ